MFLKASLGGVTLIIGFLFTGWILNWAPMDVMLTAEGYYDEFCTPQTTSRTSIHNTCVEQQVSIATLWSVLQLSTFTILPSGILMDWIGPALFSLFILIMYVGSLIASAYLQRNSDLLSLTFFCLGVSSSACGLLTMRTVYIFDTSRGRKRWLVSCCTINNCSTMVTMILFNLWEIHLIQVKDMFWIMGVLGAVFFGAQFLLWVSFSHSGSISPKSVHVNEKSHLLEKMEKQAIGEQSKDLHKLDKKVEKQAPTLYELLTGYKFYCFALLVAGNVFRIRYFLGLADYTLIYLHDKGVYLQLIGYSSVLGVIFGPFADWVLGKQESEWLPLHFVNISITAYFITWLLPNLPVQTVTFVLFSWAQLICFSVLTGYCSIEFTERRFGLVWGSGFIAASIPGAFTYKIVDLAMRKYDGNFCIFHMICVCASIPLSLIVYFMKRKSLGKFDNAFDTKSMTNMSMHDNI